MKYTRLIVCAVAACALLGTAVPSQAVDVTVDAAIANGFMNVFNLPVGTYPTDLGDFQFASGWGFGDLVASFADPVLTLAPNNIGDPNEYWYQNTSGTAPDPVFPGGPGQMGNKIMNANAYAEVLDGSLAGQTLTFSGIVISDTLSLANNPGNTDLNGNGWTIQAFIKDFAPGFGTPEVQYVDLPASGNFSVSLPLINDPARPVQYGFEVTGPNVWAGDEITFGYGNAVITAIPEPGTMVLLALGAAGLAVRRRRSA